MSDSRSNAGFQFVNASIANPQAAQDKEVRALIRKHAMKQASVTRRRQGNYGKHNLRQDRIFYVAATDHFVAGHLCINSGHEDEELHEYEKESARPCSGPHLTRPDVQPSPGKFLWKSRLPPTLSLQGYEAVVAASNFDVVDLSALVSLRLGRFACMKFSADPSKLTGLLSCSHTSYLTYLPSRYGHSTCLNDAVDCIIARVQQIIFPTDAKLNSMVILRYIKALNSLQKALYSPVECYEAEVLCATEILALYEMLNPSNTAAWIRHTAGAARLIQLRSPESFKTDFEKALLMSHASLIMTEAILNNERCFLEEEPWKVLLESLVLENWSLSHDSETAISILILKSRVPNIYNDVTSVICSNNRPDIPRLERAIADGRQLLADLNSWLCKHRHILSVPDGGPEGSHGREKRSDITSTYLLCYMIITRLLASASTKDRARMEEEAQELAGHTLELERVTMPTSQLAALFLAQAATVALSIRSTAEEWQMNIPTEGNDDGSMKPVIERWKFERWCKMLGRKVS